MSGAFRRLYFWTEKQDRFVEKNVYLFFLMKRKPGKAVFQPNAGSQRTFRVCIAD
jgi:hypothetical protein